MFFSSYGPLFMKIHHVKQCPLSKSNSFDQNFMKLGHIVKYHDVLFKFNNGPYRTMLSVFMKIHHLKLCPSLYLEFFYQNFMKLDCLVP